MNDLKRLPCLGMNSENGEVLEIWDRLCLCGLVDLAITI